LAMDGDGLTKKLLGFIEARHFAVR
jgi:hypothetical protein